VAENKAKADLMRRTVREGMRMKCSFYKCPIPAASVTG